MSLFPESRRFFDVCSKKFLFWNFHIARICLPVQQCIKYPVQDSILSPLISWWPVHLKIEIEIWRKRERDEQREKQRQRSKFKTTTWLHLKMEEEAVSQGCRHNSDQITQEWLKIEDLISVFTLEERKLTH